MYNEDLKSKFITHQLNLSTGNIDTTKAYYINLFNRIEPYESNLEKDLSDMNEEEVSSLLCDFLSGSKNYQNSVFSFLKIYYDWAINERYSINIENPIARLTIDKIDTSSSYKNLMVKDENELRCILDEQFEPEGKETIDNLYRCIIHLLFAGIYTDEIIYVKEEDLDKVRRIIKTKHGEIKISDYLYRILTNYLEMQSFCRVVSMNKIRQDQIVRTGFLIENTVKKEKKIQPGYREKFKKSISSILSQKLVGASKELKQKNIVTSGIFCRMYGKELQTNEIDMTEYLDLKRNTVMAIENPERVLRLGKQEYLTWKRAFELK